MADSHKEALERFEAHACADRDNRKEATDDLRFLAGFQWDDKVKSDRESAGRPALTINRLTQFVNQVAGDMRQSQPSIDPVPADSGSDRVYADIMSGLIRQIEYQSNASSAYNWAVQCAASCGIGHFQIVTEYADETTFDQDIRIKRILDPLSVVWDSSSSDIDRSDASECFVSEMMSLDAFKKEFGDKVNPDDFPRTDNGSGISWYSQDSDKVRVASHWYKVPVKKTIGLTADGRVLDAKKYSGIPFVRVRDVTTHRIEHRRMSGVDYLDDAQEWAGKYIPVIPVIGNESSVDGKLIRSGLIRHAKDPQRLYNIFRSSAAEIIGMQPKAPWMLTPAMIAGHGGLWARANTNIPYLLFNPDPDAAGLTPRREAPPQGSPAMYDELKVAESDMYGTTGIYPTSLGQKSNESSGRAIMARERQSDTGTYVFTDNFKASIRRAGECLIDLISNVYDAQRTVRILGEDGTEKLAEINVVTNDPVTGEQVIMNDLSSAKFDVRVKLGSSFASAREAGREAMTAAIQADPNMMKVFGDLYFEAMDFPGADKIAARIKKTMPAAIVGEGGAEQQNNPQAEQAAQAQLEGLMLDNQKKHADAQGKQIENMGKAYSLGLEVETPPGSYPTGQ